LLIPFRSSPLLLVQLLLLKGMSNRNWTNSKGELRREWATGTPLIARVNSGREWTTENELLAGATPDGNEQQELN
jgi:hypothetical protein